MRHRPGLGAVLLLAIALGGCGQDQPKTNEANGAAMSLQIHYLEIVTPDVDAVCAAYAKLHDVSFSDPVPALGNARTASLRSGGLLSVRAPMRPDEAPIVRPYLKVDDIEAAAKAAVAAGGKLAFPPTELPGYGKAAIYILGGIDHGLWQP